MRLRPFIFSALAVTALLALVASAAGTRPLSAAGRRSGALPSSLFDYTFTTVAIVVLAACVIGALALPFVASMRPGERSSSRSPARAFRTLAFIVLGIALTVLILRHLPSSSPATNGHGLLGGDANGQHTAGHSGTPTFRLDEALVVAGLILLAALLLFRRPRDSGGDDGGSAETLAEAISESMDDLRTAPDLRRAIEAAYARMERALAAIGVPRDPAEAPEEYLERALLSVDASAGAVRRLTELFEQAKFSQHEPDSRMRDDAIDALEALRDELWAGREVVAA